MGDKLLLAGKLIEIIETSRNNALRKVNEELIQMYWLVGEYLSAESKNVTFGDQYIQMRYLKQSKKCFRELEGLIDEVYIE